MKISDMKLRDMKMQDTKIESMKQLFTCSAFYWVLASISGVTERLGALGHIDTRGPFTTSPIVGLNARPKGLTAVFA